MHTITPARASARLMAIALGVIAIAFAALAAPPAARAAHPGDNQQWKFFGGQVSHGSILRIYNDHIDYYLKYGVRDNGINLVWTGWTTNPPTEWQVIRQAGCSGGCGVRYGDRFALWNTSTRKYLTYGARDRGINLVWREPADNRSRNDWSITGVDANGNALSGMVSGGSRALFNHTAGDYVVYGERDYGINLVWAGAGG